MREGQPTAPCSPEVQRFDIQQQQLIRAQAIIDKLDAQGRLEHIDTGAEKGERKIARWTDDKTGSRVAVHTSLSKGKDGQILHNTVELDIFHPTRGERVSFLGIRGQEETETILSVFIPDSSAGTIILQIMGQEVHFISDDKPETVTESFSPEDLQAAHVLIMGVFPKINEVIFPTNIYHADEK